MQVQTLRDYRIAPVEQAYDWKASALYALGLGYGANPLDESELSFVYEGDQRAVPSLCVVLGHPGFWLRDPALGIDWVKLLHGEQGFEIHRPLPPQGRVRSTHRIVALEDKGADKGAVLHVEKRLENADDTSLIATVRTTLFLRADGGQGAFGEAPAAPTALPEGPADITLDIPTLPQQALIYRLSGDYNPIHADPAIARKAGFDRPILHGLCTMGLACRAVLQAVCDNRPERLRSMFVRFSKPVFPGETIRTEFFRRGSQVRFRARALERDVIVLDRASAELAD